MQEIWKDICGYEGSYQVSNFGNVRSLDRLDGRGSRIKGRLLILRKNRNGYLQAALSKNGKHTLIYVHRLVAKAFLKNDYNSPCINHKDENKTNNMVENLEWCDQLYNLNYGKMSREYRSLRSSGENHSQARLCEKDILEIRELSAKGISLSEISNRYGICKQHACSIVNHKSWKSI